ncbi:hypothetical protein RHSIM_Rhsim01G0069100 [Rhododendron simsii]|uniref:DUF4283 domain-containing protein n=1 Tax=Rhododendron simsii TaxID=118357 RepID=A0A834M0R8_RHOSS|nr:hypothetical protein RHSIM_Rhsim01G0069100 [Rhododendron simsii]
MDPSVDFPFLSSVISAPNPSSGVHNSNGNESSGAIGNSASHLNVIDVLESVTIDNTEHLEIQADDSPTVRQINSLNAEVRALRAEVEEKRKLLASCSVRTDPVVLTTGSSWKDIVSPITDGHKRMDLQFFPPQMDGEKVTVSPPKSVELLGAERWKDCIVGHFVDKKLPYLMVRSFAFNRWGKFGLKDVLSNDRGFFFFQFGIEGACRQVLEAGPCHIGGKLMVLQEWYPGIVLEKEGLTRLPIWIQLYNVPLQYWSAEGLSYLASAVGKPLYADEMTESAKRVSFAKVCVEVDLKSSLPHSFDLITSSGQLVIIDVKYPWRPTKCTSCGVFGHFECGQNKETGQRVSEQMVGQGPSVPQNKVWVVKTGKVDAITVSSVSHDSNVAVPGVELPCINQFSILQEIEIGQTASACMGNDIDFAETDLVEPGPSGTEEYGFLPSDLGVGMTNPEAVFLALKTVATDDKQPSGGKKPGATRKPRNSKKK